MLGFRHKTCDFRTKKHTKMCFSPRGSVWNFEEWILLRILLKMAVRSFWSDLEKFPKSASGEILEGWVNILGWGPFWGKKWVPKKMVLWRNDFVVGF